MDRLIAPGTVDAAHADTAPATGTPGYATDGNPATNTPATQWPAYAYNALQEELATLIIGAGLSLDRNDNGQVLSAVTKLLQGGAPSFGIDGGAANAYAAAFTPVVSSLSNGLVLRFTVNAANTGASTFAPDALSAKPLVGLAMRDLQGGELSAGGVATVIYLSAVDKWVLVNCTGGALQITAATAAEHAMQFGQATGRLLGVQVFASNGTYTPGTYSGVTASTAWVKMCGGGGAGGGVQATGAGAAAAACGGNAGSYTEWIGPATSQTVTIGAGGAPAAAGFIRGGDGGQTSFGSVTVQGGSGGQPGGAGGPAYINSSQQSNGGGTLSAIAGGQRIVYQAGATGWYGLTVGAAAPAGGVFNQIGGAGGASPFGTQTQGATPASFLYGCGGGGAAVSQSLPAAAGFAGRAGIVIVLEFA